MLEARYELLREGMEVFDPDGREIGSVAGICRHSPAGDQTLPGSGQRQGHIRVVRTFAPQREDLHIPFQAIRDVTLDRVVLTVHREFLEDQGWHRQPHR